MSRAPATIRIGAWLVGLAALLGALVLAGDRLPPPPLGDLGAAWTWAGRTDPAVAAFSIVRLAAIAVTGYLLAASVVVLAGRTRHAPALVRRSALLVLPSIRRLIHHAVGAGLAVGVLGSAATLGPPTAAASVAPGASAEPPRTPVGTGLDPADPMAPPDGPILHVLADPPVLVDLGAAPVRDLRPPLDQPDPAAQPRQPDPRVPPEAGTTHHPELAATPDPSDAPAGADDRATPATAPAPAPPPSASASAAPPSPPPILRVEPPPPSESAQPTPDEVPIPNPAATYTIEAGDHLWGVAEQTLADAWGQQPCGLAVARYLDDLVAANRSVLAVPDDADLVFPGQVFTLPPIPDPAPDAAPG